MLISKKFIPLVSLITLASLGVNANEIKFKIGPKATHYSGRAFSGEVKNSGILYGISSELDVLLGENFRLFPSLDIATGEMTYRDRHDRDSKFHTDRSTVAEARLPIGYNFIQTPKNTLTGFSGVGYRWFQDKTRNEGASSELTVQHTYVPVGLAYRVAIGEKTALELRGEYDRLVRSNATLEFKDEDGTDREKSRSTKGNGARFQATLEKTLGNTTLFASAAYQLLEIRKDKYATRALGLTVGMVF